MQPDWSGLLAWSSKYHDGTKPSEFGPMSQEDRKWLETAMKEYTFNDTDKLKTICDALKADIDSQLEDLQDIIEIHERNSTNLARCGGLASLITFQLKHPNDAVRALAN